MKNRHMYCIFKTTYVWINLRSQTRECPFNSSLRWLIQRVFWLKIRSSQLFSTTEVKFKVTLADKTFPQRWVWMSKYEIMCLSTCAFIREDQSKTYLINQSIVFNGVNRGETKGPLKATHAAVVASCSRAGQGDWGHDEKKDIWERWRTPAENIWRHSDKEKTWVTMYLLMCL